MIHSTQIQVGLKSKNHFSVRFRDMCANLYLTLSYMNQNTYTSSVNATKKINQTRR